MKIKEKYLKDGLVYNRLDTYLQIPQILFCYEGLAISDIIVYSVIYQFCKHYNINGSIAGNHCIINNETIADRANCSISAVKSSLKKLSDFKIIEIQKSKSKYRIITLNVDYLNKTYNPKINKEELKSALPKTTEAYQEYKQELIKNKIIPYIKVPDSIRIYEDISPLDEILYGLLYQHIVMLKEKTGTESILTIQGKYAPVKLSEKLNCNKNTILISLKKMTSMDIIKADNTGAVMLKRDFFEPQPEEANIPNLDENKNKYEEMDFETQDKLLEELVEDFQIDLKYF